MRFPTMVAALFVLAFAGCVTDEPVDPAIYVGELIGNRSSFYTCESKETVRFVAVGSTDHDPVIAQKVGTAIAERCASSGCDLILHLGDIINPALPLDLYNSWLRAFEAPFASKTKKIPWYAVMGDGDHALQMPNDATETVQWYREYADAHAKVFHMPDTSYTFSVKDIVRFVALDSTQLSSPQAVQDLVNKMGPELLMNRNRWVIAFAHHPIVSLSMREPPNEALVYAYNALLCNRGTHVLITGHDHNRQWLRRNNMICPRVEHIVSGAGSRVEYFPLVPENVVAPSVRLKDDTKPGFFYGKVSCKSFTGRFYDADNNMDMEEKTITP